MQSRVYETVERPSVCPSIPCPVDKQQQRWPAGLLLGACRQEISIDSCRRRVPAAGALSSNGAAAWRSAANAGSVEAEGRG